MKEFNLDNYKDINEFYAELAKEFNEKLAGKTIGIKKMMLSSEYASAELQSFVASGPTVYVNCIHSGQPKKLSCNFMILNNMANPEDFDFSEYHELLKKALKVQADLQLEKMKADLKAYEEKREAEKKAKKLKAMEEQYESNKKRLIEHAYKLITTDLITPEKEFYVSLGYLAKHAKNVAAAMPDYLDDWFTMQFGTDAPHSVVDSKKRTVNGFPMQWALSMTITLDTNDNMPAYLISKLSSADKKVRHIADTEFVFDLCNRYGFKFGKQQNIEQISDCVPASEMDAFTLGYNL